MTVYHQFGSKPAILTTLFDVLADEGGIALVLPNVFKIAPEHTSADVIPQVQELVRLAIYPDPTA